MCKRRLRRRAMGGSSEEVVSLVFQGELEESAVFNAKKKTCERD